MEKTVKGILENLIYLIKNYGYILSGNRVYFEGRSQLPLLSQMMHSYYTFTNDESFILDNIEVKSNSKNMHLKINFNSFKCKCNYM